MDSCEAMKTLGYCSFVQQQCAVTCGGCSSPAPSLPSPSPPSPVSACTGHTFTSKADLKTAATEYDSDADAATAKYGAIAGWCVSGVTDMSWLFSYMRNLNADISGWDTSGVTDMSYMFQVRCSLRALPPNLQSRPLSPRHAACTPRYHMPHPASRPAARPAPCALLATLGSSRPSTSP